MLIGTGLTAPLTSNHNQTHIPEILGLLCYNMINLYWITKYISNTRESTHYMTY